MQHAQGARDSEFNRSNVWTLKVRTAKIITDVWRPRTPKETLHAPDERPDKSHDAREGRPSNGLVHFPWPTDFGTLARKAASWTAGAEAGQPGHAWPALATEEWRWQHTWMGSECALNRVGTWNCEVLKILIARTGKACECL